jgi:hypothetical protein
MTKANSDDKDNKVRIIKRKGGEDNGNGIK